MRIEAIPSLVDEHRGARIGVRNRRDRQILRRGSPRFGTVTLFCALVWTPSLTIALSPGHANR